MSEELNTKLSLDLDIDKVSKHLEDITSGVNDMFKELERAKDGLKDLGPTAGKS